MFAGDLVADYRAPSISPPLTLEHSCLRTSFVSGDRGGPLFIVAFGTPSNELVTVTDASTNSITGTGTLTQVVAPGEPLGPGYFDSAIQELSSTA